MNIILVDKNEIGEGQLVRLVDRRFEHIKNVLKPVVGDLFRVGIVGEKRYQAELVDISDSECSLRLAAELPSFAEPNLDLIFVHNPLKKDPQLENAFLTPFQAERNLLLNQEPMLEKVDVILLFALVKSPFTLFMAF